MSEHVTPFSPPAFSTSNGKVLIDPRITDAQWGSALHELILTRFIPPLHISTISDYRKLRLVENSA
jgi:hypothetical protein